MKYYVEHVTRRSNEDVWDVMEVGEGLRCTCTDIVFAHLVVDLLNGVAIKPKVAARAVRRAAAAVAAGSD